MTHTAAKRGIAVYVATDALYWLLVKPRLRRSLGIEVHTHTKGKVQV